MRTLPGLRPLVLAAALCLIPACSTPPPASAAAPAQGADQVVRIDIRGRVVQAHRNAQGELPVGTIVVEGPLAPDTRYEKASILVNRSSKVFVGRGGKRASFGFIHSGDLVEVTFAGPVAESDPVKATAAEVVILEHTP